MRRVLLAFVVLLVALIGEAWVMFSNERLAAEARLTGRSELAETAFGTVEYAEVGEGPPVLMIHGSGGGFDQGLDFAAPLVDAGFRLIAPSRFGYLRSSFPEEPSVELQADALDALLAGLGEEQVVIYGGSAGALSAMQLALRHPERCRALVLLVPAAYAPDRPPNAAAAPSGVMQFVIEKVLPNDFLFWTATRLVPGTLTRLLLATHPALVDAADPAERERAATILRHIFPVSRRAAGLFFDSATAGSPERYDLEEIACPVLTISAEDDLFGTAAAARFVAATAPGARLVIYPEGGHILIGHSEEANREIVDFIDSLPDALAAARMGP
jgi:pimeloyl-ACP methyl ester carboxylesterase